MSTSKIASFLFSIIIIVTYLQVSGYLPVNSSSPQVLGAFVCSPFNGTLPYYNTMPQYWEPYAVLNQVTAGSYNMSSFVLTCAINMLCDPEQIPNGESNEISVWAGTTFYKDIEWGIVARVETGKIYAFLQIGNETVNVNFTQKIIRDADGQFYTYNCTLRREGENYVLRVVSGAVDLTLIRYDPFPAVSEWNVIMKSHRINGVHLDYFANMTVTEFDLYE